MSDTPFDTSYEIGEDLRARPNDPEGMRRAVAWLEHQAAASPEPDERARALGLAGAYAGMLRDLGPARDLLERAIATIGAEGDDGQLTVLRVRLADIKALAGAPGEAVADLTQLLAEHGSDEAAVPRADFVHQHLGKALLEAGRAEDAVASLELAERLRAAKGDRELLASTRAALKVARSAAGGAL